MCHPFFINSTSQGFIHKNLISVQIKGNINPAKKIFKIYRSFKNFSEENFVNDLMKSDLDKITEIEDVQFLCFRYASQFLLLLSFTNLLCHPFFINSTSQGFIHKNVAKEIGNDNN
jgi:hypothetical protein